jgi:cystathionine beta-lyase
LEKTVTAFASQRAFPKDALPAIRSITAAQLRAWVLDADEVAVVDVREGDRYASGHISVAVELPLSEIELRVPALLPRLGVRVVVADDDGGDVALRAAQKLSALGYTDVYVLENGTAGWAAAGNELARSF